VELMKARKAAGVAEARNDVAVIVEVVVDRGGPDRNVGMDAAQPLKLCRRRDQADVADVPGAAVPSPGSRSSAAKGGSV
jgi:hypothetical protein